MPDSKTLPLLRYRDGGRDKEYRAPVTILGDVTGVDIDVVTITMRGQSTQLYVDDLEPILGGPDRTLGILLDAGKHRDRVRIALDWDRITYTNPAQLKRYDERAGDIS
jgi:hypothetical protein